MYNVVLVSGVQQSDSVIHICIYIYMYIYIYIFLKILFPYRLLQNIEYISMCYAVWTEFSIYQFCCSVYLLMYTSVKHLKI